jgi:hypothetical protein
MLARNRGFFDRRTRKDRRRHKIYHLARWRRQDPERRKNKDRRSQGERRAGWIRVSKFSSAQLKNLTISKYLT